MADMVKTKDACERCARTELCHRVTLLRQTPDSFNETLYEGYLCRPCAADVTEMIDDIDY
ncbi:unnamed protein product [marine sediment metagenome]|uniref:Uncharacterized protein n=1 Tax=marine sediment metagenome TaxID=412755 RepID=X0X9J1_9ZZZZ